MFSAERSTPKFLELLEGLPPRARIFGDDKIMPLELILDPVRCAEFLQRFPILGEISCSGNAEFHKGTLYRHPEK